MIQTTCQGDCSKWQPDEGRVMTLTMRVPRSSRHIRSSQTIYMEEPRQKGIFLGFGTWTTSDAWTTTHVLHVWDVWEVRAVHGSQVEMARPARHAAMMTWLTSSSCRLPAWSIRNAATSVPATFTAPTTMLPNTGDSKPAFANTCRPPPASSCVSWDPHK